MHMWVIIMTSGKEQEDIVSIHTHNIDIKNREIYLHSHIVDGEDEPGVDYRAAVVFEKNLRYLNTLSIEPILIHMHLPGGMWQDCLAMYDAIKFSKSKTIIVAYMGAESASSVLLQASDLRILMPNTNMMIHYGSFSISDEHSKAVASTVRWNERECDKMIGIFTDKCSISSMAKTRKWKRMMAKKHIESQLANKCDWILTPEEAVDYNFADGVLGSKKFTNIDELKLVLKKR